MGPIFGVLLRSAVAVELAASPVRTVAAAVVPAMALALIIIVIAAIRTSIVSAGGAIADDRQGGSGTNDADRCIAAAVVIFA